jgi:soluble lytic murein transglycosylase-like protein
VNTHAYDGLVAQSAAKWSRAFSLRVAIPSDLVRAVIAQESKFDTTAVRVEPDGRISRGLMQVLEGTARDLGLSNPMLLAQPAIGIDYGVKYLAQQLARYAGDVKKAVAAYNAGSARTTSSGQFVNQSYVNKVLGYFRSFAGVASVVPIAVAVAVFFLWRRRRRRLA